MLERDKVLVTNTTPLLALAAATGSLDVLRFLYRQVVVPLEVAEEVRAGGAQAFGVDAFEGAEWLSIQDLPVRLPAWLSNSLDRGEAAVIQTAMTREIPLVCIDEEAGRRVARLCGLSLTGSIGILLKARDLGYEISMPAAVQRMRDHGIWLSDKVIRFALSH